MNKKILVAAIAVATATISTSVFAATKLGGATQKGSLLIFPRVEATTDTYDYGNNDRKNYRPTTTDTYISITNDSSKPVQVQCYWATTEQYDPNFPIGKGGNAVNPQARDAIRKNHYMDFSFRLTAHQPASFWAGDLSLLANGTHLFTTGFDKLVTTINAPQFNFFQDGSQANAGELKCWAVSNDGTKEIHHNHLAGKATVVSFAEHRDHQKGNTHRPEGQAHEYNAWSFQAHYQGSPDIKHTSRPLGTPGSLDLDGKEYDQCPSALMGQFVPTYHSFGEIHNRTQITVSNCHEDLRQDAYTHITKLTYTVWNANEMKYTGAHECMGMWYESNLGKAFPHFTYKTLKTDTAYFRAQPTYSKLCADSSGNTDDVETSGVVGIQVNDIGGAFQSSSNLVGLGAGTNDYTAAGAKGQILWDAGANPDLGKK